MGVNLEGNIFFPSKIGNYKIKSNVCNAFGFGKIKNIDDFYLIGAEFDEGTNYPLITGQFFDTNGDFLLKVVRNKIIENPKGCKKIVNSNGYEVRNRNNIFFSVKINYSEKIECIISGKFYDKNGDAVLDISENNLDINTSSCLGFSGDGFGLVSGLEDLEMNLFRILLGTRGKINKIISGEIRNQNISLDGKIVLNAKIDKCNLLVENGEFVLMGNNNIISNCKINFSGLAANIRNLVLQLENTGKR